MFASLAAQMLYIHVGSRHCERVACYVCHVVTTIVNTESVTFASRNFYGHDL